MKIRTGFVSNSSSSSFIVKKAQITALQLSYIYDHIEHAQEVLHWEGVEIADEWHVYEEGEDVHLVTSMDNFDMHDFLLSIGVSRNAFVERE